MPSGTALCADWVALAATTEAQIIPLLKAKLRLVTPASLRSTLEALHIRAFAPSCGGGWVDFTRLGRVVDIY